MSSAVTALNVGGARRDRTADLNTASVALSQLSYSPTKGLDERRGAQQYGSRGIVSSKVDVCRAGKRAERELKARMLAKHCG